jgi:hypothetical protein
VAPTPQPDPADLTALTDAELLARVRGGQCQAAAAELLRRWYACRLLAALAWRSGLRAQEARDLMQEGALALIDVMAEGTALGEVTVEGRLPQPVALAVLRRCASYLRAVGRWHDRLDDSAEAEELLAAAPADELSDPAEWVVWQETLGRLGEALAGLTETERLLCEGYMQGVPLTRQAEELGLDYLRAWRLRRHALRRLQQYFRGGPGGDAAA